jgi:uncharacterized protein YegJ (DUF2314 family)
MRMVLVAALAVLGCKSRGEEASSDRALEPAVKPPAASPPGQLVKRGTLKRSAESFFGVILPAGTAPDRCEAAGKAAATKAGIEIVAIASDPKKLSVGFDRTTPAKVGWGPDRAEIFDELLAPGAAAEIDKATIAIGLFGSSPDPDRRLGEHVARVAQAIVGACKGWIVDLDTSRILPPEQLAAHVPGATFDARDMIVLHAVTGENKLGFVDTVGMGRLGLPELVIADVPPSSMVAVARILNASVQTLVERGDLSRDGELDVDIAKLSGDWHARETLEDGGTGKITWHVQWSKGDDTDAPVLALSVPGARPGDPVALVTALEKFEGATEDQTHQIDFGPELETVAVQARAALGALRPHFKKGIPPGERLSVKAPFATDHDSQEWMWVDVYAFQGTALEGALANTPDDVSTLKLGSKVKVKLPDVADFIHRRADKTNAGGYSFDVMRKHGIDVPPLSEM